MSNELTVANGAGNVVIHDDGGGGVTRSMSGPSAVAARKAGNPHNAPTSLPTDEAGLITRFGKILAAKGISDARVMPAVKAAYADLVEQMEDAEAAQDVQYGAATKKVLQAEWGTNYRTNIVTVRDYVNTQLPPSLADAIWEGRDIDGHIVGDNAGVLRWLLNLARGGAGAHRADEERFRARNLSNPPSDVESEIAEIEAVMLKDRRRYNRDEQMQARLRQLYSLRGAR